MQQLYEWSNPAKERINQRNQKGGDERVEQPFYLKPRNQFVGQPQKESVNDKIEQTKRQEHQGERKENKNIRKQ